MNPTPKSLAFFQATRCAIPAQMGRLTLHQAAEASDAISCIKTCCIHSFNYTFPNRELPERMQTVLNKLNGKMSLAQARAILQLWKNWTWPDDFPTMAHVEGFLNALKYPPFNF